MDNRSKKRERRRSYSSRRTAAMMTSHDEPDQPVRSSNSRLAVRHRLCGSTACRRACSTAACCDADSGR